MTNERDTDVGTSETDSNAALFFTDQVNCDRVRALSINIAKAAHVHDMLAARAHGDTELAEMVELSRRWWLIWQGVGLMDAAGLNDHVIPAWGWAIGELEAALLAKGLHRYRRFVEWATEDPGIPYEPPEFIEYNEVWEKWEREPHLVTEKEERNSRR